MVDFMHIEAHGQTQVYTHTYAYEYLLNNGYL